MSTSAIFDREIVALNPNIMIAVIESNNLEFSLTEVWQAYVEEFINHTKSLNYQLDALKWIKQRLQKHIQLETNL